jgi:ABC-type uncharacterized transport system permease subunit
MTGSSPRSAAIAGSDVAITVESMFSMNSAAATISGTMRLTVDASPAMAQIVPLCSFLP